MNTETHICAWCHPGTPGNHGICARHRDELMAEARRTLPKLKLRVPVELEGGAAERIERYGHRWEQVAFSAVVLVGALLVGALIGAGVAVWGR